MINSNNNNGERRKKPKQKSSRVIETVKSKIKKNNKKDLANYREVKSLIMCSINPCYEPAVHYVIMKEKMKVGALGFVNVKIPLCKTHDIKAYCVDRLFKSVQEELR